MERALVKNMQYGREGKFRPAPKLTKKVVYLTNFAKMGVPLAKVAFHEKTRALVALGGLAKEDEKAHAFLTAGDGLFSIYLDPVPVFLSP